MKPREWLHDRLTELAVVLREMGQDFAGLAKLAEELVGRLDEGRLRLAVVGQFKRGKSTLLNALLHDPLLPTGILPLTAIPTTIGYGSERRVRVTFRDGRQEESGGPLESLQAVLHRYVTEQENPMNRFGVARVEVAHPAGLLADGLDIIDMPGIGSTVEHNTRTTQEHLPACDAALFVFSPDPPMTEVEVRFLAAIQGTAVRIMFVLNKADLLHPSDRDEFLGFHQRLLREQAGYSGQERMFLVSALAGLDPLSRDRAAARGVGGVDELESYLREFVGMEKRAVLQEALQRKAAGLIQDAVFSLNLQRRIIELPREDLDRRGARFQAHMSKLEQELVYLGDRLAGERKRLLEELEHQAMAARDQVTEALSAHVRRFWASLPSDLSPGEIERRLRASLADEVSRTGEFVAKELEARTGGRVRALQEAQCADMEVLINRIRQTAADLFEVPYLESVVLDRFEWVREPSLIRQRWVASFSEYAVSWLTRLLPRRWRLRMIEQRLFETCRYLAARNIGEVRYAVSQSVDDALRRFETRLTGQVMETLQFVQAAIRHAQERQERRESALGSQLEALQSHRLRLEGLWADLAPAGSPSLGEGPL